MARVLAGWFGLLIAVGQVRTVSADVRPDPGRELELIESTERSEDPLGLDESTGRALDRAAARLKPHVEKVVLPTPERGAGLSAIAGIQETEHRQEVELREGLALVKVHSKLVSRAKHAAEVAYRLALPEHAVVSAVRVCSAGRCAVAAPGDARTRAPYLAALARPRAQPAAPNVYAELIDDAQGHALALRISPLAPASDLSLEVHYVAEAALRGGRVRFRLAARGYDPRLAPTVVRVRAPGLTGIAPAEAFEADPWSRVEVEGTWSAPATRAVQQARCGESACARRYEAAPLGTAEVRPTWLLIDASPSLEGPARSRASSTIAAVLSVLPDTTPVRATAFAARSQELGQFVAADAPLAALVDAPLLELDAATHVSSALAPLQRELARTRPRVVIISDGLFDVTATERDSLRRAQRLGAEIVLLHVGDGTPRLLEHFSRVIALSAIAERALHDNDLEPLLDAVRQLAQPTARPGLLGGEQRVLERAPKRAHQPSADGHWLSFWLLGERAPKSWAALDTHGGAAAIAALPFESTEVEQATTADTGLPAESVLSMLRTQLVPQARACLRTDRKGRGDYAVGLTFHALFAQREAYDVRVEGQIARPLASCLEALVPKLRVPAFTGRIRVRYPIHTEREPPPPVIELEPDVSETLERAFSPARALP